MARVLGWLVAGIGMALAALAGAAEEQAHGLMFERWLCGTFFEGYEPKHYTQKWDIPAEANKKHGGIPVNPKVAKYGMPLGMGDALRQIEINEPFLLIVGFWEQVTPTEKRFINAQAVRVEPEAWRKLWGQVTHADLERMVAVVKDTSLSLDEARRRVAGMKKQPPFNGTVIELNPKLDHSQRRLQCSIGFSAFFDHLAPGADRKRQDAPVLLGEPVPAQFVSKPRK
jgi:hypothetical protein